MASAEQTSIGGILSTLIPKDGVILVGWGLMAEWEEPNGEHLLTRLVSEGSNPWQVKGYFYDGLNVRWPKPEPDMGRQPGHHNPGHPDRWMVID